MDTLFAVMPYVAVAYISYRIGAFVKGIEVIQNLARNPQKTVEMLEELKKIQDAETIEELNKLEEAKEADGKEMLIERVGDQLYAYAKDTGQFLGQGPNFDAVADVVSKRFPGQNFFGTISADDPAKELVK
jgi:prefoldin subunit 5